MAEEPLGVTDDQLNAFVDSALDPDRHADVGAAIDRDPELVRRVAAYRAQIDGLHALYDSRLVAPLPERLSRRLSGRPAGWWGGLARPDSLLRRAAALAAVFVLGGLAGWGAEAWFGRDRYLLGPLVRQAVLTHQMSETETTGAEDLVQAGSGIVSVGGLPEEFRDALRSPGFRSLGRYEPVAFRKVVGSSGAAAQMTYRDSDGRDVSLYVRPLSAGRRSQFQFRTYHGYDTLLWIDGPLAYVLVGAELGEEELSRFARAVYRAPVVGETQPGLDLDIRFTDPLAK